jgi:DNA-binding LytR/AlgR family response regulator
MQLRLGIVEDNPVVGKAIFHTASQLGYSPIEAVSNYDDAIIMIKEEKPDLVIIDIQINGDKDGIELAQTIKAENQIPYIFLTSDTEKETLERVKRLNPPAYLLKPFTREDLFASIEICVHNFYYKKKKASIKQPQPLNESVFLRVDQSIQKVEIAEIIYLESDNNHLNLFTATSRYELRNSLHGFIRSANSNKFVRIHKKYVVNTDKITKISSDNIELSTINLPLSRSYREQLLSQLNIL